MKRVLVVDDAKNIRMLLTKYFESEGYEVVSATNGKDALEILRQKKFSLVFLDIKLPEMSGTEVLRQIRAAGDQTPVIVITAYPTVKNAVECTKLKSITYLQKPFTAERLRSVLSEVLGDLESASPAQKLSGVRSLLAKGEFPTAITRLKSFLAEDPENPEIYELLSRAHTGLGDAETARKYLFASHAFRQDSSL